MGLNIAVVLCIAFCQLPGRTMSPAIWTGMPWVAPKQCGLSWTPPPWCWLIHQTLPLVAASGCEHLAGADCAHGNRIETLHDTGESKTNHSSNTHQQYICDVTYEEKIYHWNFASYTFNKKSQGESEAVNANWHHFGHSTGNQCYSRDPKEQIHCAVLPVHELDPRIVFCVIEFGMWPIHHKLFNHNAWDRTTSDKWDEARTCLEGLSDGDNREENWPTNAAKIFSPPSK